jgi:hypothetical protein
MCPGGRRERNECRERNEYSGEHALKGLEIGVGKDFANGRITGRGHWHCCWWWLVGLAE